MKKLWKKPGAIDGAAVTCLGLAFLIFSLVQFHAMSAKVSWMMSPYLFPILVGILAVILGIGMLREGMAEETPQAQEQEKAEGRSAVRKAVDTLCVIAMTVLYDLALPHLGFLGATPLYLAAMTVFMGERKWYAVLAVAVLAPLALYAVFRLGLQVRLP